MTLRTQFLFLFCIAGLISGTVLAQDVFPVRPSKGGTPARNGKDAPVPAPAAEVVGADREGEGEGEGGPVISNPPRAAEPASATHDEIWPPGRPVAEVEISSGDSLTKIAAETYGRAGYWRLLKLYNDCDPAKLKIGQVIRVPELEWLLEEEGIVPLFQDAAAAVMKSRSLFLEAEELLEGEGEASRPSGDPAVKIAEAQEALAEARELFASKREGVSGQPNSMLLQLRTAGELMGEVAARESNGTVNAETEAKMAEVHERFGNALTYSIIWAREGFN